MRTLKLGDRCRRPDGAIVLLEESLPDGRWGCDLLEDPEGYPDPAGDPACHALVIEAAILMGYEPVEPTNLHEAVYAVCNFVDAHCKRRLDPEVRKADDAFLWEKVAHKLHVVAGLLPAARG